MINFQIIILGKSGAKFYASYDELYVIKTLTSEEIEQMHSLLKQYHPFVVERHGKLISLSDPDQPDPTQPKFGSWALGAQPDPKSGSYRVHSGLLSTL